MREPFRCPFCKRKILLTKTEETEGVPIHFVLCYWCGCRGPYSKVSVQDAERLWNMRTGRTKLNALPRGEKKVKAK